MLRHGVLPALAVGLLAAPAPSQQPAGRGTAVIVVGQEATLPVHLLNRGSIANRDVADLLFLRLAVLGPELVTSGDRGFIPQLARSWERRDSVTLAFNLDPDARWHDGRRVTARDVLFTFGLARDPNVNPQRALLLRHLESVTAEGEGRVVFRYAFPYGEQFYDAVWHVPPLPAHLLDSVPVDRLASSGFAQQPVGNGPYRWVRREPGRQVELASVPDFFLGPPGLDRVIFLLAREPETQLNLILDGTADALDAVAPVSNVSRIRARQDYRLLNVPTFSVGYLLFNQRAYGDRSRPHPVLADPDVRRAIAMALDRDRMVRATFGDYASVAEGPVAQLHWIRDPGARAARYDPRAAARLLASRGWRDSNRDGILDRDGLPLVLRLNYPGTSGVRAQLAAQAQEQLRRIGVRIDLVRLDGPVWVERRNRGEFDIDFSSAVMDPSPAGLVQSWSCAGRNGTNVGQYCNARVDSLMDRALLERNDARSAWREVIRVINEDAPAIFLYAPANPVAVHRRYTGVTIRPEAPWAALWRWRVTPGRQLARDRGPPPP